MTLATKRALRTDSESRSERSPDAERAAVNARAGRSAVWTLAGYGGGQVLRLGGNLLLTRLLFAEAFGVMALVTVFMTGLALFSDVGIGPSIIQSRRGDDRRFLNTAWTVQVARGAVLWIVSCALSAPFASFYGEPSLKWILPVSGLTALLAGFNSTKLFTMNRNLDMKRVIVVDLASQVAGLFVMVAWGLAFPSIWCLVAGGLVTSAGKMVLSHMLLTGESNRFAWDREAARSLFAFGRWIFLSTLLTFLVMQSDRLIFGKMIPMSLLGVYSIALMFATLPSIVAGYLGNQIVFPLYSRIHNAGESLAPVYTRSRWLAMITGGFLLSNLITAGPAMIRVLYDARYEDAGWILQLLACAAWFGVMDATNVPTLLARGKAGWMVAANATKLAAMVGLIPLGFALGGFPGAVIGFVAAEGFRYGVSAWATNASGLKGWTQDLGLSMLLVAACVTGHLVAVFSAGHELAPFWIAAATVLVTSAFWISPALSHVRRMRGEQRSLIGI